MDEPPELQDLKIPHIPLRLIASIAAVLLLLALAWTSCYTVQAESEGVVLRFGKFLKRPALSLCFPGKRQAINYGQGRAWFRSGEIRILDSSGNVERTLPFNETDRKL